MQASDREERFFSGLKNRFLQALARHVPGARSWRVWLNRQRGVKIGENVWIGYDAIIETSRPDLVTIRDRATVQIRATIIAHFREELGVVIASAPVRCLVVRRPWTEWTWTQSQRHQLVCCAGHRRLVPAQSLACA